MKKSSKRYIIPLMVVAAASAVSVSSCSGTRNLTAPQVDMPSTFNRSDYVDSLSEGDKVWWKYYNDTTLCKLIDRVLANNYDLRIALSRVEQARQLYGVSKSEMLPQLSGELYGQRETTDYHDAASTRSDEFGLKLTAAWEINLWGKQKQNRDLAHATWLATEEDRRGVQMTLVAEVATLYYRLKAMWSELAIVNRTLSAREDNMRYTKLRYEYGAVSEVVYRQAMVEYMTAAALVPGIEQRSSEANNAMAVLLGEVPGNVYVRGGLETDGAALSSDTLSIGVPSDLLTRRPDLRASQQRLKAASAAVGVAWADRFPSFRIALTGGVEDESLANFIRSPYSNTVASLAGPIFDFGKRKRKYKAAVEGYEQARLGYESDVINAFREVSDAITAYHKICETVKLRTELRDAALRYSELANTNYRGGMLAYIDVLDAQQRYLDARLGLINALRDRSIAMVNLYKVLGGGWQP